MKLDIAPEYGYVLGGAVSMYLTQQLVLLAVGKGVLPMRKATGIKAPTLYPRDSEIKKLKLTDEQVHAYYCSQRAHQNSMEFNSVFMGLYLVTGLFEPRNTAIAGAVVAFFRVVGGLAYMGKLGPITRAWGGFFHLGELAVVYYAFRSAHRLVNM